LVEIIGVIEENTKECEAWEASKEVRIITFVREAINSLTSSDVNFGYRACVVFC
jgi:hypothetical protein